MTLSRKKEDAIDQPIKKTGKIDLVVMKNIWKRFPGVIANKGIDFTLKAGQVHALLGENGAGKSTLMNILSGVYRQDRGDIYIRGELKNFRSPAQAIEAGIGMVHQHFHLVEKLSAAENIHLGWDETPWNISAEELNKRTEKISTNFGLYISPHSKIWQMSTGEQQRVEILRVLSRGANVLILDEPTSVLTPSEADELFSVIRELAEEGRAIVFISHKLDEVLEVSDLVTVLRSGSKVASRKTSECDRRILARMMIGQDVVFQKHKKVELQGKLMLELKNASAINNRGLPALKNLNLTLKAGEILGVAGVAGNGQTELAEVLTGLRPLKQGTMTIDGIDQTGVSPTILVKSGMGHIPEDRIGMGMVSDESVTHNAILREYRIPPIAKGIRIINREASNFARKLVKVANVITPNVRVLARHLSGGNQQKLIARREMRVASRVLIAVHPTRGLDIGATDEVRQTLVEHRNAGTAVLLISSDLDEILAISDRVVVMYEGEIVGEFESTQAVREEIGLLMGGGAALPEKKA
jgi:simple sugar transport system ATP-binding protein